MAKRTISPFPAVGANPEQGKRVVLGRHMRRPRSRRVTTLASADVALACNTEEVAPVFVFRDRWLIDAPPGAVFVTLADPDEYPTWWPNIVAAQRIDDGSGMLACRSVLPYTLRMRVTREVVDPERGQLRARLDGDLVGWSSWTVAAVPRSGALRTWAEFRQEVTAPGVPGGNYAILRPVLDANHRVMMWRGRRGLARHLSAVSPPVGLPGTMDAITGGG